LTLAIAKRPELLILDEPVASLDPLARRDFLQDLIQATAEHQMSVVLSSHLVADIERVCDYLIVLAAARVQAAGEIQDLLAAHYLVTRSPATSAILPAGWQVISSSSAGRQVTMLVRADDPVDDPAWSISPPGLEDLVLAYMSRAAEAAGPLHALEARR
jgi:ABC-2 type transport system ATP-binding protein